MTPWTGIETQLAVPKELLVLGAIRSGDRSPTKKLPAALAITPNWLAGTQMESFSALRALNFITLLAGFAL